MRRAYSRLTPGQKRRFLYLVGKITGNKTRQGCYRRVTGKVKLKAAEYVEITRMAREEFSIEEADLWG
jgi:hypothetical protein